MGRKKKDHAVNDSDLIGIQFTFIGADYNTVHSYAKSTIDPDTGKPYFLSKILGKVVSRLAEDIRSGKKIKL